MAHAVSSDIYINFKIKLKAKFNIITLTIFWFKNSSYSLLYSSDNTQTHWLIGEVDVLDKKIVMN